MTTENVPMLLQNIWTRNIILPPDGQRSPLVSMLETLLPVPIITLVQRDSLVSPYALPESTPLLPSVSLGDVLAEELGLVVPVNALILIEPDHLANAQEYDADTLGSHIGRILISVTHQSNRTNAAYHSPSISALSSGAVT